MTNQLTPARVGQLSGEIRIAARHASRIDADTNGQISYASMAGGLEAVLINLVRDLAGPEAALRIDATFKEVYAEGRAA